MSRRHAQTAPPRVFLIDKPTGPTSHDVVQMVRRWTGLRRVGHGGTLDPMATGLLPVFVAGATRLIEYLGEHRKRYSATLRLGQSTDTDDAEGVVIAEGPVPDLSLADLDRALAPFRGRIAQLPPVYSAVKVGGVPSHRAARRGVTLERPTREVTVYQLAAIAWDAPLLKITMTVGAGTYVRAIARDLGQALGCGAHVIEMRRDGIGPVTAGAAHTPEQLDAAFADERGWDLSCSPRVFFEHWPRVTLNDDQRRHLANGQGIWAVGVAGVASPEPVEPAPPPHMLAISRDGDPVAVLVPDTEAPGRWRPIKVLGTSG